MKIFILYSIFLWSTFALISLTYGIDFGFSKHISIFKEKNVTIGKTSEQDSIQNTEIDSPKSSNETDAANEIIANNKTESTKAYKFLNNSDNSDDIFRSNPRKTSPGNGNYDTYAMPYHYTRPVHHYPPQSVHYGSGVGHQYPISGPSYGRNPPYYREQGVYNHSYAAHPVYRPYSPPNQVYHNYVGRGSTYGINGSAHHGRDYGRYGPNHYHVSSPSMPHNYANGYNHSVYGYVPPDHRAHLIIPNYRPYETPISYSSVRHYMTPAQYGHYTQTMTSFYQTPYSEQSYSSRGNYSFGMISAVVNISGLNADPQQHEVYGLIFLNEIEDEIVLVMGKIEGLVPEEVYIIYIHKYGDLTRGCETIGGRYIPPTAYGRRYDYHDDYADDLEGIHIKVRTNEDGVAYINKLVAHRFSVYGGRYVLGRALALYQYSTITDINDRIIETRNLDRKQLLSESIVGCGIVGLAPNHDYKDYSYNTHSSGDHYDGYGHYGRPYPYLGDSYGEYRHFGGYR